MIFPASYASRVEESAPGDEGVHIVVFVAFENYFHDSVLDNCFRAFVAGEQRAIKFAAGGGLVGVVNRIFFGVADVGVFGFEECPFALPGQDAVSYPAREAVVAKSDYDIVFVGDHASGLRGRIL